MRSFSAAAPLSVRLLHTKAESAEQGMGEQPKDDERPQNPGDKLQEIAHEMAQSAVVSETVFVETWVQCEFTKKPGVCVLEKQEQCLEKQWSKHTFEALVKTVQRGKNAHVVARWAKKSRQSSSTTPVRLYVH